MGNEARGAGLLGEHARSQRTGLVRRTPGGISKPAGIKKPARSGAPDELMRLFVAIAPPVAVLDELDALAGPLRTGRQDLRWTSREAWHVTLAFLGQVRWTGPPRPGCCRGSSAPRAAITPSGSRSAGPARSPQRRGRTCSGVACPATAGHWLTWPNPWPRARAGRALPRPAGAAGSSPT